MLPCWSIIKVAFQTTFPTYPFRKASNYISHTPIGKSLALKKQREFKERKSRSKKQWRSQKSQSRDRNVTTKAQRKRPEEQSPIPRIHINAKRAWVPMCNSSLKTWRQGSQNKLTSPGVDWDSLAQWRAIQNHCWCHWCQPQAPTRTNTYKCTHTGGRKRKPNHTRFLSSLVLNSPDHAPVSLRAVWFLVFGFTTANI